MFCSAMWDTSVCAARDKLAMHSLTHVNTLTWQGSKTNMQFTISRRVLTECNRGLVDGFGSSPILSTPPGTNPFSSAKQPVVTFLNWAHDPDITHIPQLTALFLWALESCPLLICHDTPPQFCPLHHPLPMMDDCRSHMSLSRLENTIFKTSRQH